MEMAQVFTHYEVGDEPVGCFTYCPFCTTRLTLVDHANGGRPSCPQCGFVQHRNPAPTVSVLILDGNRVVLGKRAGDPGRGTWSLPSGYVDWEDDFLTAAIREAKEETGLDVEVTSIVNVVSSFVSPRFHFLGIYVTARVAGGVLQAGDDLSDAAWFPLDGPLPEMGFRVDAYIIGLAADQDHAGLAVDARYAGQ